MHDMHFDPRTQQALREFGLSTEEIKGISAAVVEATEAAVGKLEAFFEENEVVYSDMDIAHSDADYPVHHVAYIDLYTHADALRGYVKFDGWGVYVNGGRMLSEDVAELTLGPTVDDRVRFADTRESL